MEFLEEQKLDSALHYFEFQTSVKPCPQHYFHMLLFLLLVQFLRLLEWILNFKRKEKKKLRTWTFKAQTISARTIT